MSEKQPTEVQQRLTSIALTLGILLHKHGCRGVAWDDDGLLFFTSEPMQLPPVLFGVPARVVEVRP